MKRYTLIVVIAIAVLAFVVLLPLGAVATSQGRATRIEELETQLAMHIEKTEQQLAALQYAAGTPARVAYQGYLVDGGGPVNGQRALSFHIYGQETGGTEIWSEPHNSVQLSDGYFSVMLGKNNLEESLIEVFDEPERWVEVRMGAITMPRQEIGAVPYALSVPALGCRVVATATQTIPSGVITALEFNYQIHDIGNCWDPTNRTRLTAPAAGYYMAGGAVTYPAGSVTEGLMSVSVRLWHGISSDHTHLQFNHARTSPGQNSGVSVSTGMFYMNAGDSIDILVFHNMGAAKQTLVGDDPSFWQHTVNGWLVKVGN